jgi:D-amino-acid oxidase
MYIFNDHGLTKGTARVSIRGTQAAEWDRKTWARLLDLALNRPESGIHIQGAQFLVQVLIDQGDLLIIRKECEIYSRSQDKGSATAEWFSELLAPNPWFKEIIPNVSCNFHGSNALH